MSSGDEGLSSSRQANERENLSKEHYLDELAKGVTHGTISRWQLLKFTGAGLVGGMLSAAFPEVALAKANKAKKKPKFDPGYDPTGDASVPIGEPPFIENLPSRALVNPNYLPPVRAQGTSQSPGYPPSCCAWAGTYGLATFAAAKANNYTVGDDTSRQASPAYIYVQVTGNQCVGSSFTTYFNILSQGGTPNMHQAPYYPDCQTLWDKYGNQNLAPDNTFELDSFATVDARDPDNVKKVIATGNALTYGTALKKGFEKYDGTPIPYTGGNQPLSGAKHCMLIIGYDDNLGDGSFLLQNSFGPEWGSGIDPLDAEAPRGYVWIAYDTFTALCEGIAFYATSP